MASLGSIADGVQVTETRSPCSPRFFLVVGKDFMHSMYHFAIKATQTFQAGPASRCRGTGGKSSPSHTDQAAETKFASFSHATRANKDQRQSAECIAEKQKSAVEGCVGFGIWGFSMFQLQW